MKWKLSIRSLEEIPLDVRLVLALAAVGVVILLLWLSDEAPAPAEEIPPISKYEERFVQLDREALDEAYKKHVMRLFDIWVTDYDPKGKEPPRAIKGARNARDAYERALDAVERRDRIISRHR